MTDFRLALAHYRLLFPDLDSLGAGNPPDQWKAEYDRVVSSALGEVTLTSTSFEGGSGSGQKNFDQSILLRALHNRRSELDDTYLGLDPVRPLGITVFTG